MRRSRKGLVAELDTVRLKPRLDSIIGIGKPYQSGSAAHGYGTLLVSREQEALERQVA